MKTEVRYKRVQSHYMKENDIWVIPSTFYACFMHSEGLRDIFLFHIFNVHALLFIHVRQIWYIMIFSERIFQTRPQNFLLLFISLRLGTSRCRSCVTKCMKIFMNPIMDFLTLSSFIAWLLWFSLFSTSARGMETGSP